MRSALACGVLLAAALAPGCAVFVSVPPLEPLPKEKVVLSRVPCVPQRDDSDCGPASLTAVLRFYGSPLTYEQVRAQLKQRTGGGTIILEMLYGARKNGFPVTLYESSINDLRRKLIVGQPLILMLHPLPDIVRYTGMRRAHYAVAVGYDDLAREVILHSGRAAFTTLSYRQLQLQWSRAGFLALLIEEPPHAEASPKPQ